MIFSSNLCLLVNIQTREWGEEGKKRHSLHRTKKCLFFYSLYPQIKGFQMITAVNYFLISLKRHGDVTFANFACSQILKSTNPVMGGPLSLQLFHLILHGAFTIKKSSSRFYSLWETGILEIKGLIKQKSSQTGLKSPGSDLFPWGNEANRLHHSGCSFQFWMFDAFERDTEPWRVWFIYIDRHILWALPPGEGTECRGLVKQKLV